jgi:hypothetical protein
VWLKYFISDANIKEKEKEKEKCSTSRHNPSFHDISPHSQANGNAATQCNAISEQKRRKVKVSLSLTLSLSLLARGQSTAFPANLGPSHINTTELHSAVSSQLVHGPLANVETTGRGVDSDHGD